MSTSQRGSRRRTAGTHAVLACLLTAAVSWPGAGCGASGGDGDGDGGTLAGDPPVMLTPYVLEADMEAVNEAFSLSAACPWGFEHNGLDFFPLADLKPFQAVAAGTIEAIELHVNEVSGNRQVNLLLRINPAYAVTYAFEPMTASVADGQTQRGLIQVAVGQAVAAGEVIGRLFSAQSPGAHVHVHLQHGSTSICPEPHFTQEARDSILTLLHVAHPGAAMCYE